MVRRLPIPRFGQTQVSKRYSRIFFRIWFFDASGRLWSSCLQHWVQFSKMKMERLQSMEVPCAGADVNTNGDRAKGNLARSSHTQPGCAIPSQVTPYLARPRHIQPGHTIFKPGHTIPSQATPYPARSRYTQPAHAIPNPSEYIHFLMSTYRVPPTIYRVLLRLVHTGLL